MALTKRNYVSGETVITAKNLNEIQDSIIELESNGDASTHPVYYIDLEGSYPDYTCAVTMADIKAAYEAGKVLECRFVMNKYTVTLPLFIPMPFANRWEFFGPGSLIVTIVNGTVTVKMASTPMAVAAYTNQIPISTDASGAVFNGVGYQQGYQLNSSGNPSPQESTYITGFIPVHSGDTVRFEGMALKEGTVTIEEQRIAFYDANKAVIDAPYWKDIGTNTMSGGYLVSMTVPAYSGKTVAFARFGCYWIDSHSIITVNEEIK